MVHWRLNELIAQYREVTGEPLLQRSLARATGLAPSTIHYLVHKPTVRVDLRSVDALLTFFSTKLGPLTAQDLIEFVNPTEQ